VPEVDPPEDPVAPEPIAPDPVRPDPAAPDAIEEGTGGDTSDETRKRNLFVTAAVALALLLFFAIAGELFPSSNPTFVEQSDPLDDSPLASSSARKLGTPAPSASTIDTGTK
jgi:hypothetical protein